MVLPLLAGLTACGEDHAEYTPAGASTGAQVYFPLDLPASYNLASDATSFDVQIARVDTTEEQTVTLENRQDTSSTAKLTVPSSVTFAKGESVANITITYDPTTIDYDDVNTDTILIADSAMLTTYGLSSYTFQVVIPAPWKSLGKAKFLDAFIYDDETYFDVEIQQNELDADLFRLVNPYDEMLAKGGYASGYMKQGPSEYFEFHILRAGSTLYDVTASRDYVYWNDVQTGYYISDYDDGETTDGEVYAVFPGRFTSLQSEDAWSCNIVTEYQENGLPGEIVMAPYYYIFGVGGWNKTQNYGAITILFPGYVKADYSVSANYAGIMKTANGENQAVVDVAWGADIVSAKYALTDATVAESDAADAIAKDSLESTEITESGRIYVPLSADGKYRVTVVGINADGEAKASASAVFEFEAGGSSWESLGMGTYTENIMASLYAESGATTQVYEVEVLASTKTPGIYRMKNPYGAAFPYNAEGDWDASTDYYIEIDATDPETVIIAKQETGLDWGDGMFSIQCLGSYYLDNGYTVDVIKANVAGAFGTFADGVITMPAGSMLAYFGTEGPYNGNTGGDFILTLPTSSVKAKKVAAKKQSINKSHAYLNKVVKKTFVKQTKVATKRMAVSGNNRIAKVQK